MSFSSDDTALAVVVFGTFQIVDLKTKDQRCRRAWDGNVTYSPTDNQLLMVGKDGVSILDPTSCMTLQTLHSDVHVNRQAPAFDSTGKYASWRDETGIEVWRRNNSALELFTRINADGLGNSRPTPYLISTSGSDIVVAENGLNIWRLLDGSLSETSTTVRHRRVDYVMLHNQELSFESVEPGMRTLRYSDLGGHDTHTVELKEDSFVVGAHPRGFLRRSPHDISIVSKNRTNSLWTQDKRLEGPLAATRAELSPDLRYYATIENRFLGTLAIVKLASRDWCLTPWYYSTPGGFRREADEWIGVNTQGTVFALNPTTCKSNWEVRGSQVPRTLSLVNHDHAFVGTTLDKMLYLWDLQSKGLQGEAISLPENAKFSSWDQATHVLTLTLNNDSAAFVRVPDSGVADLLGQLFWFADGTWSFVTPSGYFDSNNLESMKYLNLVFRDDTLRAFPAELFLRQHYEPMLLARLLRGEHLKDVGPLGILNRVPPKVQVEANWIDPAKGWARVTVQVGSNKDNYLRNGQLQEAATGVYDLRVFRDGQLVGWAPKTGVQWQLAAPPIGRDARKVEQLDLERWRAKTEIRDLDADGTRKLSFPVQVPRRADLKAVTFTAYAFNRDRVKSATVSTTLKIEKPLQQRTGRAYVVSVGVNRTESAGGWTLQYAANDARETSQVVAQRLSATRQFAEVVPIQLVSAESTEAWEAAATKSHVQAILDVLAGRRAVDPRLKKEIPNIERARKAQPEDLLLLAFSSHGYTDDRGVFHLVLADIGPNTPQNRITQTLQRKSLSSDELSVWLRDVDAGEIVMVVDSCHSAATVDAEGFKPGPMGSRGLGQLAYSKGMRILAASKAEQSAVERDGIRHGLLTYSLVDEGLKDGLADFQPHDGKIMMSEWLAYGEQEVPKLFREGDNKGMIRRKVGRDNARDAYYGRKQTLLHYQEPVLFDFSKQSQDIVVSRERP